MKSNRSNKLDMPEVEVFLSRPAYPLGGTVVGTVVIHHQPQRSTAKSTDFVADVNTITTVRATASTSPSHPTIRPVLESVTVYVIGCCKIDQRWHSAGDYKKIYGRTHPYLQLLQERFDSNVLSQSEDTVCFWATNGMEALDLPERIDGGQCSQCMLSNERNFDDDNDDGDDDADDNVNMVYDEINGEENNGSNENYCVDDFLAFTFRVEMPRDLPHSIHAATCRYYYSANVVVKTATQLQVYTRKFQVLTENNDEDSNHGSSVINSGNGNNNKPRSARVRFGTCLGMAHSNGFPYYLSSTEICRPKRQMMVAQNHCLRNQIRQRDNNDVQTLRISNAVGRPVCILTVIGSQSLSPGSRIHLQWDFPNYYYQQEQEHAQQQQQHHQIEADKFWIPCYQVCACLQGEEYAVYENGSKKKTQTFLYDTFHEYVDPDTTDRVSKTLWLSSSGDNSNRNSGAPPPCDLSTDIMEVSTWCQVDITINENYNNNNNNKVGGGGGKYNNLSLRIPCRVRHSRHSNFGYENEQELNELINIESVESEFSNGIYTDLKKNSIMMDEYNRNRMNRINKHTNYVK